MTDDNTIYPATDMTALSDKLEVAYAEIREMDCPGNINADIPAMVFSDLAATTVRQWTGERLAMERGELLAIMCESLTYMFD